ncbi:NB-ARC domain [Fragilaria crotonensis]|nr:NB-ARC domain [Fragilaria crotonensis]
MRSNRPGDSSPTKSKAGKSRRTFGTLKSSCRLFVSASRWFAARLCNSIKEAGVFSAMALNRFDDAKDSLDQSLEILNRIDNGSQSHSRARAAVLYELGRVLRYQGSFRNSEEALSKALLIRSALVSTDFDERHGVAAILHELGVLEVKKHNLQAAADFLERALDLRRILDVGSAGEVVEADCAATLHQLAAVHLARKPPSLAEAEALLQKPWG